MRYKKKTIRKLNQQFIISNVDGEAIRARIALKLGGLLSVMIRKNCDRFTYDLIIFL